MSKKIYIGGVYKDIGLLAKQVSNDIDLTRHKTPPLQTNVSVLSHFSSV